MIKSLQLGRDETEYIFSHASASSVDLCNSATFMLANYCLECRCPFDVGELCVRADSLRLGEWQPIFGVLLINKV